MSAKNKQIAIIPARGGSKRIPGKNIKPFFGKPIIHYSIEAAKEASLFDPIVVTTDDEKIGSACRMSGVEVNAQRPAVLANDHAVLADVLHYELARLQQAGKLEAEYACLILATAPFISAEDLRKSFDLIREKKAPAVIPVTDFGFPIFRAQKINEQGRLEMIWPEHELTRSNDLPHAYHDVGQFYWLRVDEFLAKKKIYLPGSLPYQLPRWRVQDIDTPEDWERAEKMFRALK